MVDLSDIPSGRQHFKKVVQLMRSGFEMGEMCGGGIRCTPHSSSTLSIIRGFTSQRNDKFSQSQSLWRILVDTANPS